MVKPAMTGPGFYGLHRHPRKRARTGSVVMGGSSKTADPP
jgi:hypothetical protein